MIASEIENFANEVTVDSLTKQVRLLLVRVPDEEAAMEWLDDQLDPLERIRAAEFRHRQSRLNYITARACVRLTLAKLLEIRPDALAFGFNPAGKPFLAANRSPSLEFNISHSGMHCLLAFACGSQVGVDIEQWREQIDWKAIAERFFAEDERAWIADAEPADQVRRFYDCWSLKEAFMKATGVGLAAGLDTISFRQHISARTEDAMPSVLDRGGKWYCGGVSMKLASHSAAVCWGQNGPSSYHLTCIA